MLDEPTSAMDEMTEQRSLVALRQAIAPTQTLVMVTHKHALVALATRLIVLAPNRILLDGPREAVLEKLRQGAQQAVQAQGIRVVKPVASGAVAEGAV